eukprot:364306-Chlamydomonas_euryale.AAC.4
MPHTWTPISYFNAAWFTNQFQISTHAAYTGTAAAYMRACSIHPPTLHAWMPAACFRARFVHGRPSRVPAPAACVRSVVHVACYVPIGPLKQDCTSPNCRPASKLASSFFSTH